MREGHSPLGVIQDARRLGIDSVIVGVSGGMDSVVTLDLCVRNFATVRPYFMYVVPGLEFQERYLTYLERRFGVTIERMPHWMLARILQAGTFRHATQAASSLRQCRPADAFAFVRRKFGLQWIATGEKASDSLERNTQYVRDGAIQPSRSRFYPLAWWSSSDVQTYLASQRIVLPPDYRLNAQNHAAVRRRRGASFGGIITLADLLAISEHYPNDFAKICRLFPLAEAQLTRWKQLNARGLVAEKSTSEVCRRANQRRKRAADPSSAGGEHGEGIRGEGVEGEVENEQASGG